MTREERQKVMNLADMIEGEINRMCVTEELSELDSMTLWAMKNICELNKIKAHEIKLTMWGKKNERIYHPG